MGTKSRETSEPAAAWRSAVEERPASATPRLSRKKWIILFVGLAASVAVPLLAFRGVSIAESWHLILGCRGPELALAALFFLATLAVRSLRWRYMLAVHQPVGYRPCLSATCVSFLANNILPFRLSDLVRVGVLRQLAGVSAARSLGTVAVERVLDILTLVVFLGGYLALIGGGEHRAELLTAGWLALAGGAALVAVLVVGYRFRDRFAGVVTRVGGWVSPALGPKLGALVGKFLEGFQVFATTRQAVQMLLLSAALWGAGVIQYYFVGQALDLGLPPQAFVVVLFTAALGAIIPAAPGAVGTFDAAAWAGLYLVGMHNMEQGLAFAAVLHATEWVLMNVTGLYFLLVDHLSMVAAAARGERDATPIAASR
jgi:uncharacterized protein (TIRG00374 family)